MDYKVPGVFIEEVPLFPPSVAPVATGVPAFIGHTELTDDADGNTLTFSITGGNASGAFAINSTLSPGHNVSEPFTVT